MNSIRELYLRIYELEDKFIPKDLILNWIQENDYVNFLDKIREAFVKDANFKLAKEDNWELYAFSRLLDLLTLQFQKDNNADASGNCGPKISIDDYVEILNQLNLSVSFPVEFHPFYCEINEASEGINEFKILEHLSPSVKIGNLLIKRAVVNICLNSNNYNLSLVNSSKIYWTYRRKNRRFQDLSHGWGSNSQWRTELRIDLETEDSYIYNSSAKFDLNNFSEELKIELNEQNLKIDEAIELVKNRYFISVKKDDNDLFPYDLKYKENKTTHNKVQNVHAA